MSAARFRFRPVSARLALAAAAAFVTPAAFAQAPLRPGVGVYLDNSILGIGESSYASTGTLAQRRRSAARD